MEGLIVWLGGADAQRAPVAPAGWRTERWARLPDSAEVARLPKVDVLVVDEHGFDAGDGDATRLLELRLHQPQTCWIVTWRCPSTAPALLEQLERYRVQAAVSPDIDELALGRVLRALDSGDLWLPRSVLQTLYLRARQAHTQALMALAGRARDSDEAQDAREQQIRALQRGGLSHKEISRTLGMSLHVVRRHLSGTAGHG
ncbi:response regulator transcription factor [Sphaerotilus uruguayifluvii]|uniref:DNA-binding NarL/FixJ family response regulator n=1 Tax=Sphaerotilus uruguayifluvii TaxID=2735897 RepID=A0ABX2G0M6_9BURK|nr:response regulator transcription factor [Leptothrix sp. C29]NRT55845.1 DNA-binding NarL/FixJ family response regulator [Leptothrix sp. C29]